MVRQILRRMIGDGRLQDVAVAAVLARNAVKRLRRPSWQDNAERKRWLGQSQAPDRLDGMHLDIPTSFVCQAAKDYRTVVEIGASNGHRIIAVKETLPHLDCYGMDIGAWYGDPTTVHDVTFMRYTLEAIAGLPEGSLVFCKGVLTCLTPDELRELLAVVSARSMAIIYFEITLPFVLGRTVRRRAHTGFYHHYPIFMTEAGLVDLLPRKIKWPHSASLKNLEAWEYGYWGPSKAPRTLR